MSHVKAILLSPFATGHKSINFYREIIKFYANKA